MIRKLRKSLEKNRKKNREGKRRKKPLKLRRRSANKDQPLQGKALRILIL